VVNTKFLAILYIQVQDKTLANNILPHTEKYTRINDKKIFYIACANFD